MSTLVKQTSDPASDKAPRRRSRIPVSLRMFGAILALLFVGGALWVGVPIYRQEMVISEFDRLKVHYEKRPIGPDSFHRFLTKWNFDVDRLPHDVVAVRIGYDVNPRDFDPRWFQALPRLEKLRLRASWFGPVDLKFLADMRNLQLLSLRVMPISDGDLQSIVTLPNLKVLDLTGTRVTDSGLMQLAALKNLRWIEVGHTQVTQTGIDALQARLPEVSISTRFEANPYDSDHMPHYYDEFDFLLNQ